jgi:predicted RNase H-like HicB family nuclease
MKKLRIPLRIVFYKDEQAWVAHCLEFDLMGDGVTQEEAIRRLSDAITMQVEATIQYNNPANLFRSADPKYFLMFAAGRDTAKGALHIKTDSVTIDDAETREYTDSDCDDAGLAIA